MAIGGLPQKTPDTPRDTHPPPGPHMKAVGCLHPQKIPRSSQPTPSPGISAVLIKLTSSTESPRIPGIAPAWRKDRTRIERNRRRCAVSFFASISNVEIGLPATSKEEQPGPSKADKGLRLHGSNHAGRRIRNPARMGHRHSLPLLLNPQAVERHTPASVDQQRSCHPKQNPPKNALHRAILENSRRLRFSDIQD